MHSFLHYFLPVQILNLQIQLQPHLTTAVAAAPAEPQPAEFADSKYADIARKGDASLSSGDVDGWMSAFADNAVYLWNNGDSLTGKPAIAAYWKKRRGEVIDSISFKNEIFLPDQSKSTTECGTTW